LFLAIIGDFWLAPTDHTSRHIDDPGDFVRIEIETALRRQIPIVPVLVGRASMPKEKDLPEPLRPLVFRNAAELRHGRDMGHHMELLIRGLQAHFAQSQTLSQPDTDTQVHEVIQPTHLIRDKQSDSLISDTGKDHDKLIGQWKWRSGKESHVIVTLLNDGAFVWNAVNTGTGPFGWVDRILTKALGTVWRGRWRIEGTKLYLEGDLKRSFTVLSIGAERIRVEDETHGGHAFWIRI
jgi:hypothetical protein